MLKRQTMLQNDHSDALRKAPLLGVVLALRSVPSISQRSLIDQSVTTFGNRNYKAEIRHFAVYGCYVKPRMTDDRAPYSGRFVHESCGTFFAFDGADKQFSLIQGLPWEGGDSIDDYC
jgi:hypothetical protein